MFFFILCIAQKGCACFHIGNPSITPAPTRKLVTFACHQNWHRLGLLVLLLLLCKKPHFFGKLFAFFPSKQSRGLFSGKAYNKKEPIHTAWWVPLHLPGAAKAFVLAAFSVVTQQDHPTCKQYQPQGRTQVKTTLSADFPTHTGPEGMRLSHRWWWVPAGPFTLFI